MKKKLSYLFYSFETDGLGSSPMIDEEFDDATEEDFQIIQDCKEESNNDIRNSINMYGD